MTLIAVPVFGESIEQVRRDIETAVGLGAGLIELRVDLMEGISDDDLCSLRDTLEDHRRGGGATGPEHVPIILTIRSRAEGGQWEGTEGERVSRYIELGSVADYLDVELAAWQLSANIRQKIELALRRTAGSGAVSPEQTTGETPVPPMGERTTGMTAVAQKKLILSHHDLSSRPAKLEARLVSMLGEPACGVPKLVWRARTIRDNFEAFELMRQAPRPVIVICMGEVGLLSRVLAGKFGAFATFASLATGDETAPGQLPIAELKDTCRWDAIDASTRVYGVIGDPVGHSLGPRVHNAAFAATGENAVYLPLPVTAAYESFKAFMVEVLARPWLDFRGFSVTLPHKEHALRYLQESGGRVDQTALRVGAVNTMTLGPDGVLSGHNTDCPAAVEAIRSGLGGGVPVLTGLKAAVLGAGGVARAVVAGLTEAGAEVTVFNRTEDKAESLARSFGCRHGSWEARSDTGAALLVNCTSLGLWPKIDASPMPADALWHRRPAGDPHMTVFDTIYRPRQTRLLREAAERGCATIDGLTMFALQACAQFQLWTGRALPADGFRPADDCVQSEP